MEAIYSVDWSPDGSKLAFQGIRGDRSDIYICDTTGKNMVNLTQDIFSDSEPSWSPDNNTIYFTSDRRDNPIKKFSGTNFKIWDFDYNSKDIFSIDVKLGTLKESPIQKV